MRPHRLTSRKLLVASVGVAAISYVGCSTNPPASGNLMPPQPPPDAGESPVVTVPSENPPVSGNLMPPPPQDAGAAQPTPPPRTSGSANVVTLPRPPVVGNLMAPRIP